MRQLYINRHSRHLPITQHLQRRLLADGTSWIQTILSVPGQDKALQEYGTESLVQILDCLAVARGARHHRYLLIAKLALINGNSEQIEKSLSQISAFAALEVLLSTGNEAGPMLKNIYVCPEQRRLGYATLLLGQALADFPNLALDGSLTDDGASFFGYTIPSSSAQS